VHGTTDHAGARSRPAIRFAAGMLAVFGCMLVSSTLFAQSTTVTGSVEAGRDKSATCAACHGADGNSPAAEWPSLAGQHARYIAQQLRAFQTGERDEVTMTPFAVGLSEQDIADIAAFYEAQTPVPRGADPELVSLGERIYRGGIAERGVAACIACHGPSGQGNPLTPYPVISGQHATYAFNTLRQYAAGERRSDQALGQVMRDIAAALREDEMRAVASYMQGLQ
jgi:cytochrome c553